MSSVYPFLASASSTTGSTLSLVRGSSWPSPRLESVRKHSFVVLNADDPYVSKMALHTKGKVIFFSVAAENPLIKQHLGAGGTAVFVKRGKVIVASGNEVVKVGNVKNFPATLQGKAAHNIQNILAAVGAAWVLGIPGVEIGQSLSNF